MNRPHSIIFLVALAFLAVALEAWVAATILIAAAAILTVSGDKAA